MSAFVPGPAVALSNRQFLTGASVTPRYVLPDTVTPSNARITPTAFFEKIKQIVDRKMKNKDPSPTPTPSPSNVRDFIPIPAPTDDEPSEKPNPDTSTVIIPIFSEPVKPAAAAGPRFADLIPKFYNLTTARADFRTYNAGQMATSYDVRHNPDATPTNRRENCNDTFRNMDHYTEELVWARPSWTEEEAANAVGVAIKNVFGNANLFEADMEELSASISCVTTTGDMR